MSSSGSCEPAPVLPDNCSTKDFINIGKPLGEGAVGKVWKKLKMIKNATKLRCKNHNWYQHFYRLQSFRCFLCSSRHAFGFLGSPTASFQREVVELILVFIFADAAKLQTCNTSKAKRVFFWGVGIFNRIRLKGFFLEIGLGELPRRDLGMFEQLLGSPVLPISVLWLIFWFLFWNYFWG